jgi:hypothetical protein
VSNEKKLADLQLGTRKHWPADLLFLLDCHPREGWADNQKLGELARFWLAKHLSLRGLGTKLVAIGTEWHEGRLTVGQFQSSFATPLQRLLNDLESHHQVEDQHYFPIFRTVERRLERGLDVLESDHRIIHAQVFDVIKAAKAFLAWEPAVSRDMLRVVAERYTAALAPLATSLNTHLTDEEDLIIPLLASNGH